VTKQLDKRITDRFLEHPQHLIHATEVTWQTSNLNSNSSQTFFHVTMLLAVSASVLLSSGLDFFLAVMIGAPRQEKSHTVVGLLDQGGLEP
jgi:hypothetical protein